MELVRVCCVCVGMFDVKLKALNINFNSIMIENITWRVHLFYLILENSRSLISYISFDCISE